MNALSVGFFSIHEKCLRQKLYEKIRSVQLCSATVPLIKNGEVLNSFLVRIFF